MRQPNLRELAARVTDRQRLALDADRRRAIIVARDAAPLADFRQALLLGRLVICGNCSRFEFGAPPAGTGTCTRWQVEAFPFVPFWCAGFELSKTPTAPAFVSDLDGASAKAREYAK
jgi:hypothetical protein